MIDKLNFELRQTELGRDIGCSSVGKHTYGQLSGNLKNVQDAAATRVADPNPGVVV